MQALYIPQSKVRKAGVQEMKRILMLIILVLSFSFVSCNIGESPSYEYKVVFASNGGSILSDVTIKEGVTLKEPTPPTKDGYTFAGWYSDYDLTIPFDFNSEITKNITLYAKWTPLNISYNIIFISNDGTYIAPIVVNSGETLVLPTNPTKNGYIFVGWYLDEALTLEFDSNVPINSDLILYAKYEKYVAPKNVTISFVTNSEQNILSIKTTEGNKISAPILDGKENYEFGGWYLDEEFKTLFSFENEVRENITLYAKWDLIYYTISFNTNGGNEIKDLSVSSIEVPVMPNDPIKEGYDFIGWYLDDKLSIKFDNNKIVKEDITLYAKWKEKKPLSNDPSLYNIYINGIGINGFSSNIYNYNVTLTSGNQFVVNATPTDPNAKVLGNGSYEITSGDSMVVELKVTAEDGTKLTYKITVKVTPDATETQFLYCAGLSESVAATFIDENYKEAKAYYRVSGTSTYIEVDNRLINLVNGVARVDILGLSSGTYDIKVVTSKQDVIVKENIKVTAYDRSGYAFFDTNTNKIGAYNEDGTLKSNADVIYVTNETKNTVTYNGKTGLVNILKSLSSVSKPVCIRIIGSITTNQFEEKNDAPRLADGSNYDEAGLIAFYTNSYSTEYGENLVGLTSKIVMQGYKEITHTTTKDGSTFTIKDRKTSSTAIYNRNEYSNIKGKAVYDDDSSYNMVNVTSNAGLTLEGVGTNAEIFQWGINFSKSCNIEVRNLTFTNAPEDACSFSGGSNTDNNYYGIWVHNNTFNKGYNSWDITGERDKYNGDGAIDLRFVHGVTVSFNKFNNTHKTGLVGGSDSNMQYNITFHHNYYSNVSSRLPLGRQANMHIYNNYYYKCSSTLDIRANAYVLSEGNYFEESRVPKVEVKESQNIIAAVKSFNDVFDDCSGTQAVTIVNKRDDKVTNTNTYGTTFDTNTSLFYYDQVNKKSDVMLLTDAAKAKEDCINYAGVLKDNQESGVIFN